MAESQVLFPYGAVSLAAIQAAISAPRFATYLVAAGRDPVYAVGLYLYNARLAKALLFPLHLAEITLRNSVDELFCSIYGVDWPRDAGLRAILTQASLETLERAIDRSRIEFGESPPRVQIVATLTFDFWSNLFRTEYDRTLWQVHLRTIFPNLPTGDTRHDVQSSVKEINRLRNRIAHHEPIFRSDVTVLHKKIVDLIRARCTATADWVKHFSTLSAAIRTRPRPQHAICPTIGEICDSSFTVASGADSLAVALVDYGAAVPAIVRVNAAGEPTAAIPSAHLLHYISEASSQADGMVDLNDHSIDAVVAAENLGAAWVGMDSGEPLPRGIAALQSRGIKAVVATEFNAHTITITGVIVRSHRRY